MNQELFNKFIKIAIELNKHGIVPVLMGSLGLEFVSEKNWNPKDIDIHVEGDPRGWEANDDERIYNWANIHQVMNELGYELIDLHEHEFKKDGLSIEFGTINSLPEFAGVDLANLTLVVHYKANFYVPKLEDYLKIYIASSKDSYRNSNNNDKDFEKIEWLRDVLRIED